MVIVLSSLRHVEVEDIAEEDQKLVTKQHWKNTSSHATRITVPDIANPKQHNLDE